MTLKNLLCMFKNSFIAKFEMKLWRFFDKNTIKFYQLNTVQNLKPHWECTLPFLAACSSFAASSSSPTGSCQVFHCQPQFLAELHKADRRRQYGQHQSCEKQTKKINVLVILNICLVLSVCSISFVMSFIC